MAYPYKSDSFSPFQRPFFFIFFYRNRFVCTFGFRDWIGYVVITLMENLILEFYFVRWRVYVLHRFWKYVMARSVEWRLFFG